MIKTEQKNGYVHLLISRPEKKNALTRDMYQDLADGVEKAAADESVNAIVISGDGGVFTAGNDLDDFRARATDTNPRPSAGLAFIETLMNCDTPVIIAAEGLAIGIGTTMLLHVDTVYAGQSTRFKTAFVDLGLVPEAASTVTMPLHLGSRKAADLLLMGDVLTAVEAADIGLITRSVEDGEALNQAFEAAEKLATKPRGALRASKRLMKAPWQAMVKEALERERDVFGERLRSDDCHAALARMGKK
ncbi:Enoyl-CoA hydratase/carnithine racemase [Marinobacter daqiaonensis]|uniref:Enoyl-CoA hydratase/carnithine racemase n=1 Tax=Marinobacter daqiaonensis TaxID=650891 RepID=A0A1I6ILG8_9GAMM|nr:enoyl-CoA hydratase-related protein [Marinobacter daqiaonensis]SFR67553.1 Enoyl-CoA hydratase/carnithine racemase [Marinobacter daqiaonensis]